MRYVCVHGHFYQPPRENPSLEAIELQDSAYPYHDWNERITAECYAPNAASRILDGEQRILRAREQLRRDQFQFRPDACFPGWKKKPRRYTSRFCDADKHSQEKFSGHGSAIAQAYNHMILAAGQQARQNHASQVGYPRLRAPLRPQTRRHVAARNGGGH